VKSFLFVLDSSVATNCAAGCFVQVAGDGFSLLDRAVMEHNLISTARVYCNISLAELGAVLSLDADRAEKVRPLCAYVLVEALLCSLPGVRFCWVGGGGDDYGGAAARDNRPDRYQIHILASIRCGKYLC
jgi:hypothetical protein